MKTYYTYILLCSDGSYYTGVTNNITRRLNEHQTGYNKTSYTYNRRPLELKYCQEFHDINKAIKFEKQLKGWSRAKKKALIDKNYDELKKLATCKNDSHYKNHTSTTLGGTKPTTLGVPTANVRLNAVEECQAERRRS